MGQTPNPTVAGLQSDRMSYPALLPREVVILKAWLQQHESEYDRFDFNVRIGEGYDPGPTFDDEIRRMAILNTQRRVDAVGFKGVQPTIIEVKAYAGASALGQLTLYNALWPVTFPSSPPPKLALVTNRFQFNVQAVAQSMGIQTFEVPVDLTLIQPGI